MVNKSFKRNTKRRGNKVNKSRRRNARTRMTKRTKKRNTKKRLSRKSSKRRVMRGGQAGGAAGLVNPLQLLAHEPAQIARIASEYFTNQSTEGYLNTKSYNSGAAIGRQTIAAQVKVMPSDRPISVETDGSLFVEHWPVGGSGIYPNLILRYRRLVRQFDPRNGKGYIYIFIKGKVDRDNLYVGNEINMSNDTLIYPPQDKELKITLNERDENRKIILQNLLDSLPVHASMRASNADPLDSVSP